MEKKDKPNHEGFVPLFRRFVENPLWQQKRKFSKAEAWIDLLFMARYGEKPEKIIDRNETIILYQDEVLTSLRTLAKKWKWSREKVKNFFNFLQKQDQILVRRMDNRRTIIKIVKLSYFRKLVIKTTPQTKPQTKPQTGHKPTHKNKDNKDKLLPKGNKDKSRYGNSLVIFVLEEFEKRFGFKPTDRSPRNQAWNLVQRSRSFLKELGKNPTEENIKKVISKHFNWVERQDWAEKVETLSVIRRKTNIFFSKVKAFRKEE